MNSTCRVLKIERLDLKIPVNSYRYDLMIGRIYTVEVCTKRKKEVGLIGKRKTYV